MDLAQQLNHLTEWANRHIFECDALATGLLRTPLSTVFFGDRKAFRLSGSLPSGDLGQEYNFYFYPLRGPAVKITKIEGNLFEQPYEPIMTQFDKKGVLKGTVGLRCVEKDGKRFIVTGVNCVDPQGTTYVGQYYLFTLPPIRASVDGEETMDDNMHIGFLPVVT